MVKKLPLIPGWDQGRPGLAFVTGVPRQKRHRHFKHGHETVQSHAVKRHGRTGLVVTITYEQLEACSMQFQPIWNLFHPSQEVLQQKKGNLLYHHIRYIQSYINIHIFPHVFSAIFCIFNYQACPQFLRENAKPSSLHKHYHWHIL